MAAQAEAAAAAAAAADATWRSARNASALRQEPVTDGGKELEEADETCVQQRRSAGGRRDWTLTGELSEIDPKRWPAAYIAPPITPPLFVTPPSTPPRLLDAQGPNRQDLLMSQDHVASRDDGTEGNEIDVDDIPLCSVRKADQILEYYNRKAQYRRRIGAPRSADSDVSGVSGVSGMYVCAQQPFTPYSTLLTRARSFAWSRALELRSCTYLEDASPSVP